MDISFEDFAFQGEIISLMKEQIAQNRFVHATLITGPRGSGKKTLCRLIAAGLLCQSKDHARPCGICRNCLLSFQEEHPDLTVLKPGVPISPDVKAGRTTIPVDDIREVIRLSRIKTLNDGNRVFLIDDAEKMTPQAQNALLKTLEEPPENVYFLLSTMHPERLLTTIASRCRALSLHPMGQKQILQILEKKGVKGHRAAEAASLSEGSIGEALRMASDESFWQRREEMERDFLRLKKPGDILQISGRWKDQKNDAEDLFVFLDSFVYRMLQERLNQTDNTRHNIPEEWNEFLKNAPLERFAWLSDRIALARRQNQSNVHFQTLIEQLLLGFIGERDIWRK